MKKIKCPKLLKTIGNFVVKNESTILSSAGVTGIFVTGGLCIVATVKAVRAVDKKIQKENSKRKIEATRQKKSTYAEVTKLEPKEVIKTTWKYYVAPVATALSSAACIVGAQASNMRKTAALATAYKLSEKAFTEYREKVIDRIGEEKDQEIQQELASEHITKKLSEGTTNVILNGPGNTLFMDYTGKKIFVSSQTKVEKAINELNYRLNNYGEMYVSLNDFYELVGAEMTGLGSEMGWNISGGLIEYSFIPAQITDESSIYYGAACFEIRFNVEPRYDFTKLM